MVMLFIEGVSVAHEMEIDPVEMQGLRTLVITANERLPEIVSKQFVKFLKVNVRLENLIINKNVIYNYKDDSKSGVRKLMDFLFENMRNLEELVLIDCLIESGSGVHNFLAFHQSLKRFQFGIPHEDPLVFQLPLTPNFRITTAEDFSYSATCLPEDSYRLTSNHAIPRILTLNKIYTQIRPAARRLRRVLNTPRN